MKKGFKAVTAAALAISALTPVAAFAAENTVENGVYTTTNFYSLDAFKKLSGSAKAAALTSEGAVIVVAGKVYTGANVLSLNDTQLDASAVTVDAYNAANDNKLVSGKPIGEGTETGELKVASVNMINATQLEVKFNQKVDKATAETIANYTFFALDDQSATSTTTAELSTDGKTVTVTVDNALSKRYQVKVNDVELDGNSNIKVSYNETLTFKADTTAPTITGFEQISSSAVRVKFSEPVDDLAATGITYKDSKGATITKGSGTGQIPSVSITGPVSYVDFDLTQITAGEKVTITFNGLVDMAGNLVNPQPASVVVEKKNLDAFAPTISSISQTGAKTFNIKFSADLDGELATDTANVATNIVLDPANAVTAIDKVSDNEYKVTVTNNLSGLATVKVLKTKVVNKLGQAAGATGTLDKLVTFKEDEKTPTATSKLTTDKSGNEVIELTFDKDVTLVGSAQVTVSGSYVKNYLTTSVPNTDITAVYADGTGKNKKVVHIPLTALNVEGAVYNLSIVNKASNTNGIISDAGVAIDTTKVSFTRGKDASNPSANTHVITADDIAIGPVIGNNNEVTVTYTIPNGTSLEGSTATNIANYTIAGAEIESASLAAASGTTQVVTLKLKANSNTFTGVRNATIKNVKIAGSSKVMETVTKATASLNENVLPTIKSAEITGADEITLTFSESVTNVNSESFIVKAGTSALAQHSTGAVVSSSDDTKVTITLNASLSAADLAETITVAPNTDATKFSVEDLAANKLAKFNPITVVKP
ncbi:hypothetical protein M5J14_09510 [Lysinibacillus sp. OL1_EC]|uniref:hypothetical protein n=1 Tax=unclassified Lysinibacillus TaxID=2636778 RepID=UPI00103BE340|nr:MULTISPECIES: hypothetical protein [unclassified Lysinibacillus]MCM0624765.1 hypothetical protein [Lysinibacillus sp. OL1_EC]TBV88100.1 hypothetical protein EW028_10410 [Lysinibacillus sp. OL1]